MYCVMSVEKAEETADSAQGATPDNPPDQTGSPVASRSGCGLPGRKLSRLTPTNVGTLCAFLTAHEKCGLLRPSPQKSHCRRQLPSGLLIDVTWWQSPCSNSLVENFLFHRKRDPFFRRIWICP